MRRLPLLLLPALLLACAPPAAEVSLPTFFSDHMVLQRRQPIRVWGKATPNSLITVRLQSNSETPITYAQTQVVSDPAAMWRAELPPMEAAVNLQLLVSGETTLAIHDVAVGEVWLASGQSNMEWPLSAVDDAGREVAAANYPLMRLLKLPKTSADEPRYDVDAAWTLATPKTAADFSAVAYFFGRELLENLTVPANGSTSQPVPIGLIQAAWGGTAALPWISKQGVKADPQLAKATAPTDAQKRRLKLHEQQVKYWPQAVARAKAAGETPPPKPQAPSYARNHTLYRGMIAPLAGYPLQGVIWYQGESDAGSAEAYRRLFPALIADWRKHWGRRMPFLYVQLANFGRRHEQPTDTGWARLREAQLMTLAVPKTGMAVTTDIGNAGDIHPRNKQDVGRRLALWAMADVYGREDIVKSGPIFRRADLMSGEIRLRFDHIADGLQAGPDGKAERLEGFAIAGEDGKYVWAEAVVEGDTVIVRSDEVARPRSVRYAWDDNPAGNLYNSAALPASPFRTESILTEMRNTLGKQYGGGW